MEVETKRMTRLCDLFETNSRRLQQLKHQPHQSHHEKAMWQRLAMEMRDQLNYSISEDWQHAGR